MRREGFCRGPVSGMTGGIGLRQVPRQERNPLIPARKQVSGRVTLPEFVEPRKSDAAEGITQDADRAQLRGVLLRPDTINQLTNQPIARQSSNCATLKSTTAFR